MRILRLRKSSSSSPRHGDEYRGNENYEQAGKDDPPAKPSLRTLIASKPRPVEALARCLGSEYLIRYYEQNSKARTEKCEK